MGFTGFIGFRGCRECIGFIGFRGLIGFIGLSLGFGIQTVEGMNFRATRPLQSRQR